MERRSPAAVRRFSASVDYADAARHGSVHAGLANVGTQFGWITCCNDAVRLVAHGFAAHHLFVERGEDVVPRGAACSWIGLQPRRRSSSLAGARDWPFTYATSLAAGRSTTWATRSHSRRCRNSEASRPTMRSTRIVANWITDIPYLFGIQWSGLADVRRQAERRCRLQSLLRSGDHTNNPRLRGGFTVPGTFPYQNVDMRLRKDFPSFGSTATRARTHVRCLQCAQPRQLRLLQHRQSEG